jgi:hypothetical protein
MGIAKSLQNRANELSPEVKLKVRNINGASANVTITDTAAREQDARKHVMAQMKATPDLTRGKIWNEYEKRGGATRTYWKPQEAAPQGAQPPPQPTLVPVSLQPIPVSQAQAPPQFSPQQLQQIQNLQAQQAQAQGLTVDGGGGGGGGGGMGEVEAEAPFN